MGMSAPKLFLSLTAGKCVSFMGAIVSFMFIRCPKCRARLGQTIAMQTAMRFSRWSPEVKYCPFCGVSLDEPMDK